MTRRYSNFSITSLLSSPNSDEKESICEDEIVFDKIHENSERLLEKFQVNDHFPISSMFTSPSSEQNDDEIEVFSNDVFEENQEINNDTQADYGQNEPVDKIHEENSKVTEETRTFNTENEHFDKVPKNNETFKNQTKSIDEILDEWEKISKEAQRFYSQNEHFDKILEENKGIAEETQTFNAQTELLDKVDEESETIPEETLTCKTFYEAFGKFLNEREHIAEEAPIFDTQNEPSINGSEKILEETKTFNSLSEALGKIIDEKDNIAQDTKGFETQNEPVSKILFDVELESIVKDDKKSGKILEKTQTFNSLTEALDKILDQKDNSDKFLERIPGETFDNRNESFKEMNTAHDEIKPPASKRRKITQTEKFLETERFPCENCEMLFKSKTDLRKHLKKNHPKDRYRMYSCNICFGKFGRDEKEIRGHLRSYICNQRFKKLSRSSNPGFVEPIYKKRSKDSKKVSEHKSSKTSVEGQIVKSQKVKQNEKVAEIEILGTLPNHKTSENPEDYSKEINELEFQISIWCQELTRYSQQIQDLENRHRLRIDEMLAEADFLKILQNPNHHQMHEVFRDIFQQFGENGFKMTQNSADETAFALQYFLHWVQNIRTSKGAIGTQP